MTDYSNTTFANDTAFLLKLEIERVNRAAVHAYEAARDLAFKAENRNNEQIQGMYKATGELVRKMVELNGGPLYGTYNED
jgi:hypothetical protein